MGNRYDPALHCNRSTNISQPSPYFPPGLLRLCSETCVVLTFQYIVMFTVNFHSLIVVNCYAGLALVLEERPMGLTHCHI